MFAIIRTGGKQYKVQAGDKIEVEKLEGAEGDTLKIDDVLFVTDGKKATVGTPVVKGATVTATLFAQKRAPKIIVFKKKRRANYRRKKGHRQNLTVLQIKDIKVAA